MMNDLQVQPETMSSLIGMIYDAVLDAGSWPHVLRACSGFVGGFGAAIYAKTISGMAGGVYHDDGSLDPAYKQSYFTTYGRLDPATAGHLFAEVEEPIATEDILDYTEFTQSRFFREWVQPQGIVDFISAPIEKSGNWAAMFGVFRRTQDGLADLGARQRMRLLTPHIRRAVLIGKVIEDGSVQMASFGDALDGLTAGLFLVDGVGRIAYANAAGGRMLDEGAAVRASAGRLSLVDRQAQADLAEAFAAACGGDVAMGMRGISIPLETGEGLPFLVHVLPLTSGARRQTGASYSASAAVFVHPAVLHAPAAPELIARRFSLTLSELRVLVTIIQAGGVAETAEALGIGEATVKTHLHRVFSKTGTARQADLVRLVAGFTGPVTI